MYVAVYFWMFIVMYVTQLAAWSMVTELYEELYRMSVFFIFLQVTFVESLFLSNNIPYRFHSAQD